MPVVVDPAAGAHHTAHSVVDTGNTVRADQRTRAGDLLPLLHAPSILPPPIFSACLVARYMLDI